MRTRAQDTGFRPARRSFLASAPAKFPDEEEFTSGALCKPNEDHSPLGVLGCERSCEDPRTVVISAGRHAGFSAETCLEVGWADRHGYPKESKVDAMKKPVISGGHRAQYENFSANFGFCYETFVLLPSRSNCRVMGILNVTPDSFSDGGRYATDRKSVV